MGEGDLAGDDRVVVGHIRGGIMKSVLELDVQPSSVRRCQVITGVLRSTPGCCLTTPVIAYEWDGI